MVNVLVVDDNFNYAKNLINIIVNKNPKIRLCNFCTNGKEVLDLIKNAQDNIDIILLDLSLPIYDGIDVLNYIQKNNFAKYEGSIIVISGEMELLLKIRNNPYVYISISKTSGFDKILYELNTLIDMKEEEKRSIDYKIHMELKKLYFNFTYVGTKYIAEVILLLYKKNIKNIKLEKEVYPLIAQKHKTTVNNVKTNIINSCNLMYYDCDFNLLNNYFGIVDNEKPTPKLVITNILDNLKFDNY